MVEIFISFATEDFVTPAHHETVGRICRILTERNIRGCFHLTGDYARSLRHDRHSKLVEALRQHEIGYHSNTHGAYPFIGTVCENNTWDDAVAELMLTESRGLKDLEEIFGIFPQYYVTEFTKAPQLICALNNLGVDTLGLSSLPPDDESPFAWYAGSLCYTGTHQGLEAPFGGPERFQKMVDEFEENYCRESHKANGCIKLFNHPYKFNYDNSLASWVSKNRIYREYADIRQWQIPHESIYSPDITNTLFEQFERILDYALSKDDVVFRTISEIARAYHSPRAGTITTAELMKMLPNQNEGIMPKLSRGCYYSPAEIFGMMSYALSCDKLPEHIPVRNILGPAEESPAAVYDPIAVEEEISRRRQMPNSGPEIYMVMAELLRGRNSVEISTYDYPVIAKYGELTQKTWTKPSYPDGFTGENICRSARLQSWTWKPALRSGHDNNNF